jgi:hypothetical protein
MITIKNEEISPGDVVKILAIEDDVEETFFGVVGMNTGNVVGVHYLTATDKVYKSATVYYLEEEMQCVFYESLCEHYPETTLVDLEFKEIEDRLFVELGDIDAMDDRSDVWTPDDSGDDTSLSGFIVSDHDSEGAQVPENADDIDREWDSWEPRSSGARSFKDTVDYLAEKYSI